MQVRVIRRNPARVRSRIARRKEGSKISPVSIYPIKRWSRIVPALTGCLLALALTGCEPFSSDSGVSQGFAGELENDFAEVIRTEGQVECQPKGHDYWACRVESDPGSGWSGTWHLKIGKDGCWQARPVGSPKGYNRTDPKSDLSFGGSEAFGRAVRGCNASDS